MKRIDQGVLVDQAIQMTRQNRWLWWLGFFAGAAGLAGGFNNTNPDSSSKNPMTDTQAREMMTRASTYAHSHIGLIVLAAAAWIAVLLLIAWITTACQAGLIMAVNELAEEGPERGAKHFFKQGRPFAWRLIGLGIVLSLLVVGSIGVAFVIGASAIGVGPHSSLAFGILTAITVVAIILAIAVVLTLAIARPLCQRLVVLDKKRIGESIVEGVHIVRRDLVQVIIGWLVNLAITFATGFLLVILLLVLAIVCGLIGGLLYLLTGHSHLIGYIGAGAAGVVAVGVLCTALGAMNTLIVSYLTLFYRQIR